MELSRYTKFFLMLLCSALSMYITMYFNTYELGHVFFSVTRLYMTLIGVGGMAIVMFLFMRGMYTSKRKNRMIVGLSLLIMGVCTFLVRTQKPIGDLGWMKAMIPHHSIAILTSERANIKDPEVQKLSKDIIEAQRKEIAQMKKMIERLEGD
ncbi:DUF305 domain-containing protein [Euzebyella saccharophila]|uniref:DUF305 domain-containing protein n=1 Tax=Euzebyella saccharophila TaxID=679664 RepID=A0ABV8JTY9_9FLAO|nr:DUF305 domain-containing protein [Euzebyella saccharophila]